MIEKVKTYIETWQMLKKEDCVIVGVSGGADSICLLWVLYELQKEMGFRMVAVHVNHGLRGQEADADEQFVKTFCDGLGVCLESFYADVELIAKKWKQSTEEAGREVRKRFFEETVQKYGGTKIALAHHQDDSAETFFLNLARGTGLRGLGGIAPVKGNVIRPLLCVRRTEIEEFLKQRKISYCVDGTNQTDAYTRNRIRNHVLPYLQQEVNAKTVEHMNEVMERLRQVQDYLDGQVELYLKSSVDVSDEEWSLFQEKYEQIPEVLCPLLLKKILAEVCGREKDLEAVHVKQLQELFTKQVGRKLDLPYGMEAKRTYQGIVVSKKTVQEKAEKEVVFDIRGEEKTFSWGKKRISCRVTDKNVEKVHTKRLNCDIIKNDICIRTRRQGDYITIHEDGRKQKLKSFFINEKIPQEERDHILLVAVGSHILWIAGYRTNPLYEVRANTKRILEIQIDEGENDGREY